MEGEKDVICTRQIDSHRILQSLFKPHLTVEFSWNTMHYNCPCAWQMETPRNVFRETERESLKMSVFKRLLYHNGFRSYPNSDVLDPKQTSMCTVFRKNNDLSKYPAGTLCTCIPGWNIMYLHTKPQRRCPAILL